MYGPWRTDITNYGGQIMRWLANVCDKIEDRALPIALKSLFYYYFLNILISYSSSDSMRGDVF